MEYGEGEDAQGQGARAAGKVPTAYTNISEKRVQQSQDAQALGPGPHCSLPSPPDLEPSRTSVLAFCF